MQLVFVIPELCLFVSSCAFIAGVANVCEGEFGAGNHPCRNCTDQKREGGRKKQIARKTAARTGGGGRTGEKLCEILGRRRLIPSK